MRYLITLIAFAAIIVGLSTRNDSPLAATTVYALEGPEAVGIIVKNGSRMTNILSQFTLDTEQCDPAATSTDPGCLTVKYQGRPVNVFYTAPIHIVNTQFNETLGAFPFSGRVDYVNRSDDQVEPRLIEFMLQAGSGSYTVIREFE